MNIIKQWIMPTLFGRYYDERGNLIVEPIEKFKAQLDRREWKLIDEVYCDYRGMMVVRKTKLLNRKNKYIVVDQKRWLEEFVPSDNEYNRLFTRTEANEISEMVECYVGILEAQSKKDHLNGLFK